MLRSTVVACLLARFCSHAFVSSRRLQKSTRVVAAHPDLISFDLDDTLFDTGKTVEDANKAMLMAMQGFGCTDVTIPQYLATAKAIRSTLTDKVTYRSLREMTIRSCLQNFSESQGVVHDLDKAAVECYEAWELERHRAAERHLYGDAISMLASLRELYPTTCIAAVTNGAGNPLAMRSTLAPFFDFRVSGEDMDVFPHRKPHPFIYEHTLAQFNKEFKKSNVECWIHVGDCLANDVGASASCGAKAIWYAPDDADTAASTGLPAWSTATLAEIEEREKQRKEGKAMASATIRSLSELPRAINGILESSKK